MKTKRHILALDPTAFIGGSKTATENMLQTLDRQQICISVLTADTKSWKTPSFQKVRLNECRYLSKKEHGLGYFLRHSLIALQLLITRLRYGRIDIVIGASGPGVDLAIYLARPLLKYEIIQLIHGPVANSRTIGRCLLSADQIHCLESARSSVFSALSRVLTFPIKHNPENFHILENGLSASQWPSQCQYRYPRVLWAASLLKWKGLDTFVNALQQLSDEKRPQTHICYIRPQKTALPVTSAPQKIHAVSWHEAPDDLDQIRASTNIFVSSSSQEPFGLSILEAMAAGHCILLPADGAYWDKVLEDGINCIKYTPHDATELAIKLYLISQSLGQIRLIGMAAAKLAKQYKAEKQYRQFCHKLLDSSNQCKQMKQTNTKVPS